MVLVNEMEGAASSFVCKDLSGAPIAFLSPFVSYGCDTSTISLLIYLHICLTMKTSPLQDVSQKKYLIT
jgi:hypothetical protein